MKKQIQNNKVLLLLGIVLLLGLFLWFGRPYDAVDVDGSLVENTTENTALDGSVAEIESSIDEFHGDISSDLSGSINGDINGAFEDDISGDFGDDFEFDDEFDDEEADLEEGKPGNEDANEPEGPGVYLDPYGTYTSADDVALFLHTYQELPDNFMTKEEARELGWNGGSLENYAPGMCIGGDKFGNSEGLLPKEKGRKYYECDIDTLGAKNRGAKRIVYSNDGLIYYTDDHYESFTLLYGGD